MRHKMGYHRFLLSGRAKCTINARNYKPEFESLFSINARLTANYIMVKNEIIPLNSTVELHILLLSGPPNSTS